MKKGAQITDSPKRQYLIDRVIQKSSPKISSNKLNSEDLAQKRLKHIEALTEELNLNRKKYEKLLSDHAEEKKHCVLYIKQLESEKEKINF